LKSRLSIIAGLGSILILAVGFCWLIETDQNLNWLGFEPRYNEQPLSYWLENVYQTDGFHVNGASRDAILHFGTKALPLLLNWIAQPEPYEPHPFDYARLAVEGFKILGPVAQPAVPKLIKIIGHNGDYAQQALVGIGPDAVPLLSEKLVATLADQSDPYYFGLMRREMRKTSGFYVRSCILDVLAQMGTNAAAAMPALITVIQSGCESWMNPDAFHALAIVGTNNPDQVVPVMASVLTNTVAAEKYQGVEAAQALAVWGTNHTRAAIPFVLAAITEHQGDESTRCYLVCALATIAHNQPAVAVPALMAAYTDSSWETRGTIAESLMAFGDEARFALPWLTNDSRHAVSKEYDIMPVIKLATAARTIAPELPETLDPLIKALSSRDVFIRQQTMYALGRLGTNAIPAVPALLKCLSTGSPPSRYDANQALVQIGVNSEEYIVDLGSNLSSPNEFVRGEASSSLGPLAAHSRFAFRTLVASAFGVQVPRDERDSAKWTLVTISRDNPQFMLDCLTDDSPVVRTGALKVFYDLERFVRGSIPKLQELAASDPDAGVRDLAARVLEIQGRQ